MGHLPVLMNNLYWNECFPLGLQYGSEWEDNVSWCFRWKIGGACTLPLVFFASGSVIDDLKHKQGLLFHI